MRKLQLLTIYTGEENQYGLEIISIINKKGHSRSLLHVIYKGWDDYYLYIGLLFRCFGKEL